MQGIWRAAEQRNGAAEAQQAPVRPCRHHAAHIEHRQQARWCLQRRPAHALAGVKVAAEQGSQVAPRAIRVKGHLRRGRGREGWRAAGEASPHARGGAVGRGKRRGRKLGAAHLECARHTGSTRRCPCCRPLLQHPCWLTPHLGNWVAAEQQQPRADGSRAVVVAVWQPPLRPCLRWRQVRWRRLGRGLQTAMLPLFACLTSQRAR